MWKEVVVINLRYYCCGGRPHSATIGELLEASLYSLGSDLKENTSTEQTAKKTRLPTIRLLLCCGVFPHTAICLVRLWKTENCVRTADLWDANQGRVEYEAGMLSLKHRS
jgi:hypothetical protein